MWLARGAPMWNSMYTARERRRRPWPYVRKCMENESLVPSAFTRRRQRDVAVLVAAPILGAGMRTGIMSRTLLALVGRPQQLGLPSPLLSRATGRVDRSCLDGAGP